LPIGVEMSSKASQNLTLMLFVFDPGAANTAQQIAFAPESAEHVEDVTPGS
jgi:hypothetical protein